LATLIPPTEKASAIGFYHTLVGLLLFPASLLFGLLWEGFGASVAFFFSSSMAALALVLFLQGSARHKSPAGLP
jgi:uncharacterized membrane protein